MPYVIVTPIMTTQEATESDRSKLIEIGIPSPIAATAVHLSFFKGEIMIMEGFPVSSLMIITEGLARVSCTIPSGRKLLLNFYRPGDILGVVELPLMIDATSLVEACEPTQCTALPLSMCRKVMSYSIEFNITISRMLANIVNQSSRSAAVNLLSSLRTRLSSYIVSTQNDGVFKSNYTHLAEMLGASSRHLFRELANLCNDGILIKTDDCYQISDLGTLNEIASECTAESLDTGNH